MVCSAKKESASIDTGSTNEVSSYDEDEEMRTEEQMDRSKRDGGPEESGGADRLQTVDLMDRSDVHGRPSERQNDGFLRDDQTVNLVDRSDIHGRPSARQNDVSLGDDQTVDREVEDGRPSPRQKVSDPEHLQTVDPVDRSTDSGRPSSTQQAVENLGHGQREKRPNVRLADYVTHVAGSHVGEKCKYPLASQIPQMAIPKSPPIFSIFILLAFSLSGIQTSQAIRVLQQLPDVPPILSAVLPALPTSPTISGETLTTPLLPLPPPLPDAATLFGDPLLPPPASSLNLPFVQPSTNALPSLPTTFPTLLPPPMN
ncbi:unnamed protein product [Cuscuta campestris]|uniref:Uncharacterized protein n=1 Tax=Cuscuta campestris TaxID=132261 RepID=A0A484LZX6_9ASTE|nr:unnamed protein product [Cuscuta campestris]